jgi:hypothetical protein
VTAEVPFDPHVARAAGVVDDDALVGVDDEVVLDRRHAEIAPQLVAQVGHGVAGLQHLEDDDRIGNFQGIAGHGVAAIDQREPAGAWGLTWALAIATSSALATRYLTSPCTTRSGDIAVGIPSTSSQRSGCRSAQARNSSTDMICCRKAVMAHITMSRPLLRLPQRPRFVARHLESIRRRSKLAIKVRRSAQGPCRRHDCTCGRRRIHQAFNKFLTN